MCFFFSSRRRHTRWNCDWSSDVCSSDLIEHFDQAKRRESAPVADSPASSGYRCGRRMRARIGDERSEERRVGKECRSRWAPQQGKKMEIEQKCDLEHGAPLELYARLCLQ